MPQQLILAMAAHVALSAALYVLLTVVRAPSVWGMGRLPDGSHPWVQLEKRVSANLSNQFEWPLFFHAACLLLIHAESATPSTAVLAWTFIAGRVLHSCVQICTTNVRLRGLVFTINFVAVLGLWVWVVHAQL